MIFESYRFSNKKFLDLMILIKSIKSDSRQILIYDTTLRRFFIIESCGPDGLFEYEIFISIK